MKKWLVITAGVIAAFIMMYTFLYNGISGIEKISVQKRNPETDAYVYVKTITDDRSIDLFTKILNRANHEKQVHYSMEHPPDYEVLLVYDEEKKTDVLSVWKNSGPYTLIIRGSKNDLFKISDEDHRRELLDLLEVQ